MCVSIAIRAQESQGQHIEDLHNHVKALQAREDGGGYLSPS